MDDTASLLIYIASACRDQEWRDELEKHLKRLVKQKRSITLGELAEVLTCELGWRQAEPLWEQAKEIAYAIKDSYQQADALRELVRSLALAQCWEQAEGVMRSIKDSYIQVQALQSLVEVLLNRGSHEKAVSLVQHSWLQTETRTSAFQIFSSVIPGLLVLQPDMGIPLYHAFQWVDAFLSGEIVEPFD